MAWYEMAFEYGTQRWPLLDVKQPKGARRSTDDWDDSLVVPTPSSAGTDSDEDDGHHRQCDQRCDVGVGPHHETCVMMSAKAMPAAHMNVSFMDPSMVHPHRIPPDRGWTGRTDSRSPMRAGDA